VSAIGEYERRGSYVGMQPIQRELRYIGRDDGPDRSGSTSL